jgi:hypothetical protein
MESARALQIVDVLHWEFDFVFKVQDDNILFNGFDTKNNVIPWLINLVILNDIRCRKLIFAIGIFKEVQLHFSLLCGEENLLLCVLKKFSSPLA